MTLEEDAIYTTGTTLTLCDLIIKICHDGLPVLLTAYCAETDEELFSGNLNYRGLRNLTFTDCYQYLYDTVESCSSYSKFYTNCVDVKINRNLVRNPL